MKEGGRKKAEAFPKLGGTGEARPTWILPTFLYSLPSQFLFTFQITLIFLALFPGISPGIWELDSWLEELEGGKGWKEERTEVGMKRKPEIQFVCVAAGARRGAQGLPWGVRR